MLVWSGNPPTIPVRNLFAGFIADIRGQYIFPVHIFRSLVVSVVKHYPVFSVGLDMAGVGIEVGPTANTMLLAEIVPKELRGLELLLLMGVGRRVVEVSVVGQK